MAELNMDDPTLKSLRALLKRLFRNGVHFTDDFTYEDWQRLQVASQPYPELTPALKATLRKIEPVTVGSITYWPCMALRSSGHWQDYVYLTCAADWYPVWGVWPKDDQGKQEIRLEDVQDLRECPSRLPARFANELYRHGESGMGYTLFEVEFSDGSCVAYQNGDAIDFLTYPPGKTAKNVIGVRPHAGRHAPHPFPPPEYFWCLFSGSAE